MTELIVQNYNHPSIVVWGLSNEISAMEEESETETGTWKKVDEHTIELTIDDETQSLAWNEDTLTLNVDGIKMNLKK